MESQWNVVIAIPRRETRETASNELIDTDTCQCCTIQCWTSLFHND